MSDGLFTNTTPSTMDEAAHAGQFEHRLIPLMSSLLSYFQRRVDPTEDAHDCVSETLVVLWRQQHRLPVEDDALRAYTFGVARKVLQNQRRGRVRRDLLDHALREELNLGAGAADGNDEVSAMLGLLAERDRELVTLVVLDGFSIIEAGAAMGMNAGAARMRYSRARAKLRKMLTLRGAEGSLRHSGAPSQSPRIGSPRHNRLHPHD